MEYKESKNSAYIDGSNLHNGSKSLDWDLDYKRFRVWLLDKYNVDIAYIFIGLISKNKDLYNYLGECGYVLVFKDIIHDNDGKVKGNCDSDLVVKVMSDMYENKYNQVVIVSSDGDFSPLIKVLMDKAKILTLISPYKSDKCSVLLKRTNVKIVYLSDQELLLKNEKPPV